MSITAADVAPNGTSIVTVRMPQAAKQEALHVFLNGADVTGKFSASACSGMQCLKAPIGAVDGLRQGKNVFQAEGETQTGAKISARARFDGRSKTRIAAQMKHAQAAEFSVQAESAAVGAAVAEPFLPPTVGIKTLNAGGYQFGQSPWIQVGSTSYPTSTPQGCSSGSEMWTVIVFDRQTLAEKTSAPESSPRCFGSNANMTAYLNSLPQGDLVIAGTNSGFTVDGSTALDTTAIGGTTFGAVSGNPYSYMIIGATGATPGSAFQPHDQGGYWAWPPTARGILQEDANGDYNFMSGDGDLVRFAVVPNSPAGMFNDNDNPTTSIQLSLTGSQQDNNAGVNYISYTPPADAQDGFWLLRLNRGDLERLDDCASTDTTTTTKVYAFKGCGVFYQTNTQTWTPGHGAGEMARLAQDLKKYGADPWELLFLTTVGHATCCNWSGSVAAATGYSNLHDVLEQLGGTPALATYGSGQTNADTDYTPAYSLVTATGLGNPLAGPVAESSTALIGSAGQTGTLAGTLERNNDAGLFTPGQINQEFTGVLIAKGGLDNQSVINTQAVRAPVDWPAQSQATKLPGADSIDGQIAAYRFISLSLLRDKYAVGISGSHQDDLHYFFTGSLNTSIDYHYFDPIDLPWPVGGAAGFTQCSSVNGNTCTYNFASDDTLTFTQNDFNAVRQQTSLEVRYLTNVLQYFVTGSTNMRDSIIGGNANVGLALTGAAASVLGNQLQPVPPTTTVTTSWQSILGMVNGILTVVAGFPGVAPGAIEEIAVGLEKYTTGAKDGIKAGLISAGAWSNELAGLAGVASGAGSIKSSTTTTPLPSKYSKFATTIGQLASGALQDQLTHGFDAAVDSITSDWGRISTIGPRIVNVDDPAFFVPNQVVQETVLDAIGSGAQRTFYAALMPSFFEVHYWPGVEHEQPDMGYYTSHTQGGTCWAFYLNPHENTTGGGLGTIPPYVSTYVPRPGGMPSYFSGMGVAGTDYYLIAKPSDSKGSDTESITTISPELGAMLFSPQGLNIPILQFVHPYGPMSSVFRNAGTTSDITTHSNSSICASQDYKALSATQGGGNPTPVIDPSIVQTETSLATPGSGLVGNSIALTATVKVAGRTTPVTEGVMYFRIDDAVAAAVPMQADGIATYAVSNLVLGSHTIKASYGTAKDSVYDASSSDTQTLTIYGDGPDFKISTSASSIGVARGNTSSPVTVSIASMNGAKGNVSFACSGLPMGATCNFSPAQGSITDGGTMSTTMTVSAQKGTALGFLGLLFLPMFGANGQRRRKAIATSLVMGAMAMSSLTGCHDDKKVTENSYQVPTGTVQVLVTATVGDITRTVPVSVTISQ